MKATSASMTLLCAPVSPRKFIQTIAGSYSSGSGDRPLLHRFIENLLKEVNIRAKGLVIVRGGNHRRSLFKIMRGRYRSLAPFVKVGRCRHGGTSMVLFEPINRNVSTFSVKEDCTKQQAKRCRP